MAKMRIDELNDFSLRDNSASNYQEFLDHYFDPMQISKRQKEQRKEAAKELMDIFLYFLIWCEDFPEEVVKEDVQNQFVNRMKEVVFQYSVPDDYLESYIPLFISNLIETTLDHKGEEYFTSVERAAINGANESNTVFNHIDLENAKAMGFKNKTWKAEIDNRTRKDHYEMNGWTVPIDDWFVFEDCMMQFPHDYENGTERQLANCRCSLSFS